MDYIRSYMTKWSKPAKHVNGSGHFEICKLDGQKRKIQFANSFFQIQHTPNTIKITVGHFY